MTSTATSVVAAPAAQVQQILLRDLIPSPDNPRRTIDPSFLAQLADSIAQLGVQVPLLARPIPPLRAGVDRCMICGAEEDEHYDGVQCPSGRGRGDYGTSKYTPRNPRFEIIAGHRRHQAALQLKLETVPCIVREMSDEEAREIMLVENLQREDLPPMEEAEAYEALRATLGSTEAIAARVGKPVEYVTRRLKLLSLIPYSRTALAERLIALDHALLLSKLAPAEQELALRFALKDTANKGEKTADIITGCLKRREDTRYSRYWEPESVLSLKAFIEREIKLELKRAPWDLADATLVSSAGPCVGCPKNTAANAALFGDLAVDDARCTDSACFAEKRAAFVQRQLDAVKAAGKDAVRVSWKPTSSKPRSLDDSAKYLAQVFKAGQWIDAKKGSCEFVRVGITVDFDAPAFGTPDAKKKPGMQVSVCVEPDCRKHKKAWKAQPERRDGPVNFNSEAERAKRAAQAELNKAENAIRAEAIKAAIGGVSKLGGELLRRVVQQALPDYRDRDFDDMFPGLEEALETEKVDSLKFARAAACVLLADDDETYLASPDGYYDEKDGRDELIKLLAAMGYDARKHWLKKSEAPSSGTAKAPAKKLTSSSARKSAVKKPAKAKRVLSGEARARIADAVKKRWAAQKKGGKR